MSEIIKMGKGDIAKFNSLEEQTTPDAKTRALRRTMLIKSLNTHRCTSPEELKERFEQLFDMCFRNNFIPTVEALALCSGIDRRTLWDMENVKHAGYAGYADIIKNAKDFIATLEAELARDGEINSTVYIFRAKNYYGMADKQEVVLTPNTGVQEPVDAEKILKNVPQITNGENADK